MIQKYIDNGFKPYRYISKSNWNSDSFNQCQSIIKKNIPRYAEDEKGFYIDIEFNNIYLASNFNAMLNGGLAAHFVKGLNFNNVCIFGLVNKGEPPTIIKEAKI